MKEYMPLILAFAAVLFLVSDGSDPSPNPDPDPGPNPGPNNSLLTKQCDDEYWNRYADLCDEMAESYPDGWTPQAVEEWNEGLSIIRRETHAPINKLRSEATEQKRLREFAETIRSGLQ